MNNSKKPLHTDRFSVLRNGFWEWRRWVHRATKSAAFQGGPVRAAPQLLPILRTRGAPGRASPALKGARRGAGRARRRRCGRVGWRRRAAGVRVPSAASRTHVEARRDRPCRAGPALPDRAEVVGRACLSTAAAAAGVEQVRTVEPWRHVGERRERRRWHGRRLLDLPFFGASRRPDRPAQTGSRPRSLEVESSRRMQHNSPGRQPT